jgi:hypothetical protein
VNLSVLCHSTEEEAVFLLNTLDLRSRQDACGGAGVRSAARVGGAL